MRVASAFHAMRSVIGARSPIRYSLHDARPDEIVRAQELERARHLPGVEIALLPHHVFEIGDLAVVDEQRSARRLR